MWKRTDTVSVTAVGVDAVSWPHGSRKHVEKWLMGGNRPRRTYEEERKKKNLETSLIIGIIHR